MPFYPTAENIHVIRHLLGEELSVSVIARQLNCSEVCVRKWRRRILAENDEGDIAQEFAQKKKNSQ